MINDSTYDNLWWESNWDGQYPVRGGYRELVAANESGLALQWKTSRQNPWNTKVGEIPHKQLKVGEAIQLHVFINDCGSNYALSAMLKADDRPLQEGWFCQLDRVYSIDLNQFYYATQSVGKDTTLTAEIRKSGSDQLIAGVDVLRFRRRRKSYKKPGYK